MTDVHELEKGMELTRKEYDLRRDFKDTAVLKEFLASAEDKLRRLQADSKTAQVGLLFFKWLKLWGCSLSFHYH